MNNNANNKKPRDPDPTGFRRTDEGLEALKRTISLLRSWAATPSQFDHINVADRENLFLTALELAESAQASLSPSH